MQRALSLLHAHIYTESMDGVCKRKICNFTYPWTTFCQDAYQVPDKNFAAPTDFWIIDKMADGSLPDSLGPSRWRSCQIP